MVDSLGRSVTASAMVGEITQILEAIRSGDATADELIRVVYHELRELAAKKLAHEKPGNTLEATALVHEAYLRLEKDGQNWENRRHFFAAAAEAMRRILVESARRKKSQKHGGKQARSELDDCFAAVPLHCEDMLAVDEALQKLEAVDLQAARLVKYRYFAGLTIPETAEMLGISPRTADRVWAYARAWLHEEISGEASREGG
jgi:RNA polymerase sigma factor (TIGR02999 family)